MDVPYTIAVVSAVVVLWLVLIVYGMVKGKRLSAPNCPDCGRELSLIRKPTSFRQAIWGGWTCPTCGCHVDRWGLRISQ
jgi:predicted RNA-binding Zn-ribbon protein involved in translation (DUF1610 family)